MPQPGLEPGPSDPESSTLTTGLLTRRNSEIAVLRGAVGQYNVIHTLPYESVPPMHKSTYVVECPQTSLNMCVIVDGFQFY